jgi:enoyl-CoA hydratase/carnithine racemase
MSGLDEEGTLLDYQRREPWMWHLANLAKPVIAAVNGVAYGGGAVMAICADIRIGCPGSAFRVTAVPYGGLNATWNLPLIVGWGRAKEWLLTGRVVPATEALAAGLLNHLVEETEVVPRSVEMAAAIASNPPAASQALKSVMHENIGRRLVDAYAAENTTLHTRLPPGRTDELFKNFLNR